MTQSSSHSIWRSLSKPIRKWKERRRFRRASRTDVFRFIYETNKWEDQESRSGKGSNMTETSEIRKRLPETLAQLSIESILDLPCGDMNWMATLDLSRYRYIGADIVPSLIERNRQEHPELTFDVLDICEGGLPEVDFMLSRDLFVHLSFRDIGLAIENIRNSRIRYLACTTFPGITVNQDKLTGNHRKLNMSIAPFNFGEPSIALADGTQLDESGSPQKCLGIWEVASLI
ncbi:MAG TPA: class I SAM-dependent methyltransferase [Planctomycetes bacterium]|nr:class I SAM-dependent methyltransferase [Planctomycetota bacterium]HIK61537.1 class I SAM-dependent methyltransferase [Planctomycetota bacterium]